MHQDQRHILIILDGYGIAEDVSVSAVDAADRPYLDSLFQRYPHSTLVASGRSVGLPRGQMGNSEVGHTNLGAGRTVHQDITRINLAIEDGSFYQNQALVAAATRTEQAGARLHFMGLFSDGGVHSQLRHLFALLRIASEAGLANEQVCVHAFTDGRDTAPDAGLRFIHDFRRQSREYGPGRIASIIGRYYAMDRDQRWGRVERAYNLLTEGNGTEFEEPEQALEAAYAAGTTDEFIGPCIIGTPRAATIRSGDSVIFFNFRADRGRQLVQALTGQKGVLPTPLTPLEGLYFVTLTPYDRAFDLPVAYRKVNLTNTLGEVLAVRGARQVRVAETEKYPHVTYFFSGGREQPFAGEDRILVPSPKVATYDLQPAMSAPEVARRCAQALATGKYHFVCLNFANPDMVGHTGNFDAAVKAVEAADAGTRVVVEAALTHGYGVTLLADHGNADKMREPDGSPHTAHTTALVPHLIIKDSFNGPVFPGKLGDVAPTILTLMGEGVPDDMTGEVLVRL